MLNTVRIKKKIQKIPLFIRIRSIIHEISDELVGQSVMEAHFRSKQTPLCGLAWKKTSKYVIFHDVLVIVIVCH